MSGLVADSPERVIRQLLIDLSLGTASGSWPIKVQTSSESPDNLITVVGTAGVTQGRIHTTGVTVEKYGIQILIRSATFPTGSGKAHAIANSIDTNVNRDSVTVGGNTYLVQSMNRTSPVIPLGTESPTSKRSSWSINYLVSLRQTS